MIYNDLVSDQTTQKKDMMNELKLYHRIGNFSIQIQLLITKMLKKNVSRFMAFDR